MSAEPINFLGMWKQSLLTLCITFTDPLNRIHLPQVKNPGFNEHLWNGYNLRLNTPTLKQK